MQDALQTLLTDLKQDNSLKAWSLIITFFGDSIAPRGGAVSASTLQTVMALCGIGGGTVRTALSRLSKDGWVERDKSGRYSFYRLSEKGALESSDACAKIYAAPVMEWDKHRPLYVVISTSEHPLAHSTLSAPIELQKNVYLIPASYPHLKQLNRQHSIIAEVTGKTLPEWLDSALLSDSLTTKYRQLCARVDNIDMSEITHSADALALRTILIHEWRRLRLRPGHLDQTICPTAQHKAHQLVANLYHQLSHNADQWLQQHGLGPEGSLALPNVDIQTRFR